VTYARKYLIHALALLCLYPAVGGGAALLLGIIYAVAFGNPYAEKTKRLTKRLLAVSIVGLGAGMNLATVAEAGAKGIGYTAVSIAATLGAGLAIGRLLRTEREASLLLSVGTAICGGSAIAAVAPAVNAKSHNISVALGVVFLLNALALFLFPMIGHWAGLSETQFGLWAALAIHDTSSVVGAGMKYGPQALAVGTTVKLARALWIVPLVFAVQAFYRPPEAAAAISADGAEGRKPPRQYPWFILGFLAMAAAVTFIPVLAAPGAQIAFAARRLLVLTLFLIGANLTPATLREVGARPLVQGVALWLLVAATTLAAIHAGLIS
jgi:uncharacterized integral membrane protein (TIGR00698 family)